MFRPRLTLIGWPPEPVAVPEPIPAQIAIRNRALETILRAKRDETHDQLRAEVGGL